MKTKKIDTVKRVVRETGTFEFKENRARISKSEISDQVLRNMLSMMRGKATTSKETYITIFHNNSNIVGNDYTSSSLPIPSRLFSLLMHMYGEEWGRLMGWILLQSKEEILVPQLALASCHVYGFSAIRDGKKPNHELASVMMSRLPECPFSIYFSDYVPNSSCRVVENYECPDEILYCFSDLGDEFVDLWTGYKVEFQVKRGVPSPLPEVEAVRAKLLSQKIDYKSLLEGRLADALNSVNRIENPREKVKQLAILSKISSNPAPQYSAAKKSARLYTEGASFQNLTREARKTIFSGFRQFDLKQAQLMIVSKLWDAPELVEYFQGLSIWTKLQAETGLKKDTLKKGVYTLIFGGTYTNAVNNMADVEGVAHWKLLHSISTCKFFKLLEDASKRFSTKIKQTNSCLDAFGRELVGEAKLTAETIRSIKGCQAQSYEVAIMMPVLNHLLDSGFKCLLLLHDGFIAEDSSYYIYQELRGIAQATAKRFGMNIVLEMEVLD